MSDRGMNPRRQSQANDENAYFDEMRKKFQFTTEYIPSVPVSKSLPEEALPPLGWRIRIIDQAFQMRENIEAIIEEQNYHFDEPFPEKSAAEIASMLASGNITGFISYCIPDTGNVIPNWRPESVEEYFSYFKKMRRPDSMDQLLQDDLFAEYFVSGLNPIMIYRLEQLMTHFPIHDDQLKAIKGFELDSIDEALNEGRLFVVDYQAIRDLKSGNHPLQSKYVYAPIVLLAISKVERQLKVIAIQTGQDPENYPILTPGDGKLWLIAKLIVKIADANYHEVVSHLGMTHLIIEPIVISSYRQLGENHPIKKLLTPHFEGTMAINAMAVKRLISPGGRVDKLLTADITSFYELLTFTRNQVDFKNLYLPNQLRNRGVDDSSQLKHYPYREDGLLIWNAIRQWVQDYISIYYRTAEDLKSDHQLQNWAAEIAAKDGGNIPGFGEYGKIVDIDAFIDLLTMIIFTASAQHAAMNFPQKEVALVSAQPLAGYAPAPSKSDGLHHEFIDYLPPIDRALSQTHVLTFLSSMVYRKLGDYDLTSFDDPRIKPFILKFHLKLWEIESEIKKKNRTRLKPYEYLMPSNIPQSINI